MDSKDFRRLFDLLHYQAARYPQKNAIVQKEEHRWVPYATEQCIRQSQKLAAGLLNLGLKKGDCCALIAPAGSTHWLFLDLALQKIGVVVVPIHATATWQDMLFILKDAAIKYCFVKDRELFETIQQLQAEAPNLKAIYSFDKVPDLPHYLELETEPEDDHLATFQTYRAAIHEDDLATIIYTSGTTGQPKGVKLSHKNLVSNIKAIISLVPVNCDSIVVSYLPLSHVFERMVVYAYIAVGASIHFAPHPRLAIETIQEVRPHYFTTVPLLLERFYVEIIKAAKQRGTLGKRILNWAIQLGERFPSRRRPGLFFWTQLQIADLLVFRHWRKRLGNRVQGVFVGAASLQEKLARLFSAAGIHVREGYGLTETSPVVSFNRFDPGLFNFGTVGVPIPGVEVKIDHPNEAGEGEILVKGPNVMLGYHQQEEATKNVMTEDGWLRTGDIGKFVHKRFLKITDRKKDIFKTSSGKYVAPQAIENRLKSSPYIDFGLIIGYNRPFVVALIRPNESLLKSWCEEHAVHWTALNYMVLNPRVIRFFQERVAFLNQELEQHEKIRAFYLISDEWTPQEQLLTPTLKPIRPNLEEKYQKEIEALYNTDTVADIED